MATRKERAAGRLVESDERARYYRAKADAAEAENAKRAARLVDPDVIETVLGRVVGEIAAALDALPAQIKRDIPHLRAGEIDLIRKRLARCRNALARIETDNPAAT